MRFVIFPPGLIDYPQAVQPWEKGIGIPEIARVVRAADALGYDYLTMPDHIGIDVEHAKIMGPRWPDALTMLGWFAALTERISMFTSVLVVPYRHPLLIAKGFATIDWLTGGRLALGVGVGHSDGEFDALGVSFADRGRISDEYLMSVKALWTEEAASFHGEHVDFTDIICSPRPVQQPHPPIFVGGNTKAAMRRAATHGDGWYPWTVEPRDLPAAIEYIHDQPGLRDHPRPFDIVMPMARLNVDDVTHVDKGETIVPVSREAIVDELGILRDAGTTIVTTSFGPTPSLEAYLERITWFAEEILPAFQEREATAT